MSEVIYFPCEYPFVPAPFVKKTILKGVWSFMFKFIRNMMLVLLCFVFCLCSQQKSEAFAWNYQNERVSQVLLGGESIGIEYTPKGLPIISVSELMSVGFRVGDIIYAIDDEIIYS